MSIGWFADLDTAKDYFDTNRPPVNSPWDNISDDKMHERVITYAFNRLYYSSRWSLPIYSEATADQLEILQLALMEMSIYIITHLADEDRRKGLQAQGVIQAGIVKEAYDKDYLDRLPIPATVEDLLDGFEDIHHFYAMNIDRDEEEDVNEDVTDL